MNAFSLQLSGRLVSTGLAFITVSVSARFFGPSEYGILTGALAFASLFAAFGDFGVNTVVTRRVAERRAGIEEIVRQSLGLTLCYSTALAMMASLLALAIYGSGSASIAWMICWMAPFIVFQCVGSCLTPVFQVSRRFFWYVVAEVAAAVATLAGMLVLASLNASVFSYVFVATTGSVSRLLVLWVGARKNCKLKPKVDLKQWKGLLFEASPIGATSFIGVLYYRIDVILLTLMVAPFQVGIYSLAYRIIGVVSTIPSMLVTSSFFDLAESSRDPSKFRERATSAITMIVAIISPLVLAGILGRNELIDLVAGEQFDGAGLVLAILLIAILMKSMNTVQGALLTAKHQQKSVLFCGVVSLFINVFALLLLVPTYGAIGAALALVLAEVGPTLYMLYALKQHIAWAASIPSLASTCGSLCMLALAFTLFSSLPFVLYATIGAVFYVLTQVIFQPALRLRLRRIYTSKIKRKQLHLDKELTDEG